MKLENAISHFFNRRILLHIGFWTVTLVSALLGEVNDGKFPLNWFKALHLSVHFAGFVAAAYINLYVLIPRYLLRRSYIVYFFFALFLVISSTLATQELQVLFSRYILRVETDENVVFLFFHISFYCAFVMMLTTLFYFLRRKMSIQEMGLKLQEVEKQQVMSELKALKSQINPHFFFNALNSIYSLALENSTKTPDVVLKLSALMRYIIYESSAEKVSLDREFEFVSNYIELEKSRFEDSVNVQFGIYGQKPANVTIAPLIFIPFIENAFKHCNKTDAVTPAIKISFDTSPLPTLIMTIENTMEQQVEKNGISKGFGLENVKKRLDLIYGGKHTLLINDTEGWYKVRLEIELSLT